MPLINCKVELKLKWRMDEALCLSVDGNNNDDANLGNIIFILLSKTQNYKSLQSFYQQKTIKNYRNFLAKDLKDSFIGMNIKQEVRIKIRQITTEISSNYTLQELTDCLR